MQNVNGGYLGTEYNYVGKVCLCGLSFFKLERLHYLKYKTNIRRDKSAFFLKLDFIKYTNNIEPFDGLSYSLSKNNLPPPKIYFCFN